MGAVAVLLAGFMLGRVFSPHPAGDGQPPLVTKVPEEVLRLLSGIGVHEQEVDHGETEPEQEAKETRSPLPSKTANASVADIVEAALPAVVSISTYNDTGGNTGQGSGFFIAPGKVLTNAHVVKGAYSAEVETELGYWDSVTIVIADEAVDLAVLDVGQAWDQAVLPLLEAEGDLRPGVPAIAIGNPLGLEGTVTEGIVSALRQVPGGMQVIQFSAAISPGSSGGPLLDGSGRVMGVTSATIQEGQNLNFAVGVKTIHDFLDRPIQPKVLKRAKTRILWKTILKGIGAVLLGLLAIVLGLAFGGGGLGWAILVLAVMLLYGAGYLIWWLGRLVVRSFRRGVH